MVSRVNSTVERPMPYFRGQRKADELMFTLDVEKIVNIAGFYLDSDLGKGAPREQKSVSVDPYLGLLIRTEYERCLWYYMRQPNALMYFIDGFIDAFFQAYADIRGFLGMDDEESEVPNE